MPKGDNRILSAHQAHEVLDWEEAQRGQVSLVIEISSRPPNNTAGVLVCEDNLEPYRALFKRHPMGKERGHEPTVKKTDPHRHELWGIGKSLWGIGSSVISIYVEQGSVLISAHEIGVENQGFDLVSSMKYISPPPLLKGIFYNNNSIHYNKWKSML